MQWKLNVIPRTLHFKEPAGTSRGVYLERQLWYIIARNSDGALGIGECAPLHDLSCDAGPDYEQRLLQACADFEKCPEPERISAPSMRFGLETALLHAKAGSIRFWDTPFSRGEKGIPINGLIWMGTHEKMLERLEAKMAEGFRCIKLKIGAIDFEQECDLMRRIRQRFPNPEQLELRLDANGAFSPEDAPRKLDLLAAFQPHSIEQPIRQGQWKAMGKLCKTTPIPIALDEELIGVTEKEAMLDAIQPQYIILKPSLHGGLSGSEEWIRLAQERGAGFWATSALESNIGLNAIAQWCATLNSPMPQGLGTGKLFTDNMEDYPLSVQGSQLCFDARAAEPDLLTWLRSAQ